MEMEKKLQDSMKREAALDKEKTSLSAEIEVKYDWVWLFCLPHTVYASVWDFEFIWFSLLQILLIIKIFDIILIIQT